MDFWYAPTSPFAREVRAPSAAGRRFADESRGLGERFEAMLPRVREAFDATLDHVEITDLLRDPTIGEISAAVLPG